MKDRFILCYNNNEGEDLEDLTKYNLIATKHVRKKMVERDIDSEKVRSALVNSKIIFEGSGKEKAICRANEDYYTVIIIRMSACIKIISCRRSSWWERRIYDNEAKQI
ncbi:MAG: DUF4258 domain-containing protein [Candidatus Micrarchaeota archaeon]